MIRVNACEIWQIVLQKSKVADRCSRGEAAMRVVVFGTGGAGGYFGAQLALAGEHIAFIARGEHLKAIQSKGLRLETPTGEAVIQPA